MRYTSMHPSFFNFIFYNFGCRAVRLLKSWIYYNKQLIIITARNKYLLKCKRSNVFPKHLKNICSFNITFYNNTIKQRQITYTERFMKNMLNLEICDNFKKRRLLISCIYSVMRDIEKNLPMRICHRFFSSQNRSLHKFFLNENDRLHKKLISLKTSIRNNDINLNTINDIGYRAWVQHHNGKNNYTFSFNRHEFPSNDSVYDVELRPSDYILNVNNNLLEPREKWFLNTCNTKIPDEVAGLLQLGEDFCLPPTDSTDVITQCIKHIENNFSRFQGNNYIKKFRTQIFPFLNNLQNIENHHSVTDFKIIQAIRNTNKFVKNHPDVLFTRADKGNTVVALDRMEYISKMEECLSDTNTYSILQRNPINKVLSNLKEILKRWVSSKFISTSTYNYLNTSNPILPRAYGLPKIHKPGLPLRIIVSSSGSPLHNFATYLQRILHDSLPSPSSHIINSYDLINKLDGLYIPDDCALVSLDVVSLFTNVPIDLVIDILDEKWSLIEKHSSIPKIEFLTAIKFILHSTFFIFNNKYYKQTFGAPMGSPLSPTVADLALQKLETSILGELVIKPKFYYRFVDDIALAAPYTSLDNLLHTFNSFHPRLSFTMEVGGNTLNFLDVSLLKRDGYLIFDWFQKPTFSGRFLNYNSQHPCTHKKGTIISLIDRVIMLSHPEFHKKNFDLIIKVLIDNGYPLKLIFTNIKKRLLQKFAHQDPYVPKQSNNSDNHSIEPYFTVPYILPIAKKFMQYFKNISFCKLAFTCYNKLNKYIKVHKDPLPLTSRPNVVYKINCQDCEASYVGQTKRTLNTRIGEHRNHIRRNSPQSSVITDHRLEFNHEFDWNNVEVLDEEKNYNKRLISEMIHIKRQRKSINLKKDTELLHPIYNELFH